MNTRFSNGKHFKEKEFQKGWVFEGYSTVNDESELVTGDTVERFVRKYAPIQFTSFYEEEMGMIDDGKTALVAFRDSTGKHWVRRIYPDEIGSPEFETFYIEDEDFNLAI